METITPDVQAESSPAPALEVPRDPKAYAEWRSTGKLPEPVAKPKADSTPAKDNPASKEGKTAPASETGKTHQENKPAKDSAAARLNETLPPQQSIAIAFLDGGGTFVYNLTGGKWALQ